MARFFKGIAKLRPQKPKYSSLWDPSLVLDLLKSWGVNKTLSLEKLTKKLVILLALSTAQRVQTLSKIRLSNVLKTDSLIQILISDPIKTSALNRNQPVLKLPFFMKEPLLCAASTIVEYLDRTKNLRQEEDFLILTIKKPYHPASSQTLSRWIKTVLSLSGVDTKVFTAHSTRHVATSVARGRGISVDVIKQTAGWTEKSAAFATFYNKPVINPASFASAVLDISEEVINPEEDISSSD